MDAMWDGGWLDRAARGSVTVTWLMAVKCGDFEFRVRRFVLLVGGAFTHTLARIVDLFSLDETIYVRLYCHASSTAMPPVRLDDVKQQNFCGDQSL
jgi:hypothetical protein